MTWDRDFRASTVDPVPGTGTVIGAIKNWSARQENDVRQELASASVFPQATYLASKRPMATFTTEDLVGSAPYLPFGTCVTSGTGGIDFWGQKQDCSGVASSGHVRYTIANGVLVPRSLTVNHQGIAQLSWETYARYDGVNSPIVRATGSLPAGSVVYTRHQMYSAQIAGVSIEGKRSITIDFNPQIVTESADNTVPPTVVSVTSFAPRVTIQGVDPNWFDDFNDNGVECAIGNTVIYLKEIKTAIGSAGHVRIRVSGVATVETILDATNTAPGQTSLVINCGTTATDTSPISFESGVTIV